MGNRAQGGNGGRKFTMQYSPRRTREEKDNDLLTCRLCKQSKIAKGNFYFCKTHQYNKRVGRYYYCEFYTRTCITCKNREDRIWSREHPEQHAATVRKSWQRLHSKNRLQVFN